MPVEPYTLSNMTVPNQPFFRAGGTLPIDSASYVVREADKRLTDYLRAGEYCYVLDSRQMGKSSLCVRTLRTLRGEGRRVVFLDLTRFGSRNITPEQWYFSLASELGSMIGLKSEILEFWESHQRESPMKRFFEAIGDVALALDQTPLCVMFDEIDVTLALPFPCDEFFAGIRECFNRRIAAPEYSRLSFCLIGAVAPAELCNDPSITPFNIGRRVELDDFKRGEAAVLAQGLPYRGPQKIRRILYWTGGHPYHTQAVGAEAMANPRLSIDRVVDGLFFRRQSGETDVNLGDLQYRLLNSAPEGTDQAEFTAAILDLYAKVRSGRNPVTFIEGDPLFAALAISGLTRIVSGRLKVRNRIYRRVFDREWISRKLPMAEVTRQRAAARLATLRASLVAGLIVACIGALAWGLALSLGRARSANDRLAQTAQRLTRETVLAESRLSTLEIQRRVVRNALANSERSAALTRSALAASQRNLSRAKNAETSARSALAAEQKQLRLAAALRYDATMNLVELRAKDEEYSQAGSLLQEVSSSINRGWEWGYWHRTIGLEPRVLRGDDGPLDSVAFSPDGRFVLTGADDGTSCLWSTDSGRLVRKFISRRGPIGYVALNPRSGTVLTVSGDGYASLWNENTGGLVADLSANGERVAQSEYSLDGSRIVTACSDGFVRIWNARTGALKHGIKCGNGPALLAKLSPNGERAFVVVDQTDPAVWELRTRRRIVSLPTDQSVASATGEYSRNGGQLAVISPRNLSIYDASNLKLKFTCPSGWYLFAGFSPNGIRFVTDGNDGVIFRDAKTWNPPQGTGWGGGGIGQVMATSFSPDSQRLVTGHASGTICLWDLPNKRFINSRVGQASDVRAMAFGPDSNSFVSGCADGTATIWYTTPPPEPNAIGSHTGLSRCVEFSQDSKRVTATNFEGSAGVWKLADVSNPLVLVCRGAVVLTRFSSHDKEIAVGSWSDRPIRVFNVRTGAERGHLDLNGVLQTFDVSPEGNRLVAIVKKHAPAVYDFSKLKRLFSLRVSNAKAASDAGFSPDGSMIATSYDDGTTGIWNAKTGSLQYMLRGTYANEGSRAFSPDSRKIILATRGHSPSVFDCVTGRKLFSLLGPISVTATACFSSDGLRILTASSDRAARVFDARTGDQMVEFKGHDNELTCATFSPDGKRVATAARDSTVRVWDAQTGHQLLAIQSATHGSYSHLAFSPDGKCLAGANQDGFSTVWSSAF
jgi:WD40 repeat protein